MCYNEWKDELLAFLNVRLCRVRLCISTVSPRVRLTEGFLLEIWRGIGDIDGDIEGLRMGFKYFPHSGKTEHLPDPTEDRISLPF